MSFVSHPTLPLPEPLRAAELDTFTHYSVAVRLPEIARRVLAENTLTPQAAQAVQALIDEIPSGQVRSLRLPPPGGFAAEVAECGCGSSSALWDAWTAPYLGQDWLAVPWFFAEEYFYARILEATGFFHDGTGFGKDPYAHQKRLGLETTRPALAVIAGQLENALNRPPAKMRDSLSRLLLADLWGNQNDLSLWPVKKGRGGHSGGSAAAHDPSGHAGDGQSPRDRVLDDHFEAALDFFFQLPPRSARVDILLDNAGYELVADLALADFLLTSGSAAQVTLHAKCQPVFVSDALEADIHDTIDFLLLSPAPSARALALRLRTALVNRRLQLSRHPFWTSPLPAWEMPPALQQELDSCALLIVKGDANYRRLLGDRHWDNSLPFDQVVDYFSCGVLALRTLKSEITTGVPAGRVPQDDPKWMINGRWGLVQFAAPKRNR